MMDWFRKLIGDSSTGNDEPSSADAVGRGEPVGPVSPPSIDSDAPVQDTAHDRFDRAPFAFRIAETLISRTDPASLVIAIYGAWGDGKTTVLNFIRERFKSEPTVISVNFNPWRWKGEDELLTAFFMTLAKNLDEELKTATEKIGDVLNKYSFVLKAVKLDDVARGAGALMSAESLDQLRDKISKILRDSGKRVVVMIDDIDRLEKSEIQGLFRLVKLTADFDSVAYVLAFDEAMVSSALGERFSTDVSKSEIAGMNFLEKIVQVGLHLPPTGREELLTYAFEQVNEALSMFQIELPGNTAVEFSMHFTTGIGPRLRTPRMAKRYSNALQFSLGILRGEVRYIDLMLLEAIRTFHPRLYLAIRDEKTLLLNGQQAFDAAKFVREYMPKDAPAAEIEGMARIIRGLFPATGGSTYFSDWRKIWSRDKRVCAPNYFDRYFTYAVKANDVSDIALDELLNFGGDDETFMKTLLKLYTVKNSKVLISKLRDREEELTPEAARRASLAMALISDSLPTASSVLDALNRPLMQAAAFDAQALRRIPGNNRLEIAKEIVDLAASPLFVAGCMLMMAAEDEDDESGENDEKKVFTPEEAKEFRVYGAKRIVGWLEEAEKPFFALPVEHISSLMYAVQRGLGPDAARERATLWLEAAPESAVKVIRAYKGKGTNLQSGLPVETPFMRQMYDAMIALIPADDLIRALTIFYGDDLGEAGNSMKDDDLLLAKEFIAFHERAKQQKSTQMEKGSDNN